MYNYRSAFRLLLTSFLVSQLIVVYCEPTFGEFKHVPPKTHEEVTKFFRDPLENSKLRGVLVIKHSKASGSEAIDYYGYIFNEADFNAAKLGYGKLVTDLPKGTVKIKDIEEPVPARITNFVYDSFATAFSGKTYKMIKIPQDNESKNIDSLSYVQ